MGVVRRAHDALARGDTAGFVREMTEDVEGMSRVMAIEGVTYRGRLPAHARRRPFDEASARDLVRRDVERSRNFAVAQNHDTVAGDEVSRMPLSSIAAPTLVIHGTADPMFPLEHGMALADEIPNASLLTLEGAGHGVYRVDWETIVHAVLEHSAAVESTGQVGGTNRGTNLSETQLT